MTKYQLMQSLFSGYRDQKELTIAGVTGILQSIQREDGSGNHFNVTLANREGLHTVYVSTVD